MTDLDAAAAVRLADVTISPLPEGASGADGLKLDALPGCCVVCDEPLPRGRWRMCGSLECKELYDDVVQRVHRQQRVHKQLKRAAPPNPNSPHFSFGGRWLVVDCVGRQVVFDGTNFVVQEAA